MNIDRYKALREGDMFFLARGIGVYAAELNHGGEFMHPGDDTGRVAAAAFHKFGPDGASEVLYKFMQGYNMTRKAQGDTLVSIEEVKNSAPLALSVSLNSQEIQQVLKKM